MWELWGHTMEECLKLRDAEGSLETMAAALFAF